MPENLPACGRRQKGTTQTEQRRQEIAESQKEQFNHKTEQRWEVKLNIPNCRVGGRSEKLVMYPKRQLGGIVLRLNDINQR
jgi:hypothetical protein